MNKMETSLYTVLTYFISFGAYCYRYPTKSKSFAQRHPSGVRVMGLRGKNISSTIESPVEQAAHHESSLPGIEPGASR